MKALSKNIAAIEADPRWAAVVARDATADGAFYYSVKSTGVYCRPSCAARLPRTENLAFHATRADAEKAGFRPCKRCQPEQMPLAERHAATIAAACRWLDEAEEIPKLETLAARAGMSPGHFHRLFRAIAGVTPKAYAAARRAQRLRDGLDRGSRVTEAIFAAGYHSNSRFYERSNTWLGMRPGEWRRGGANTEIRFAAGACSLGSILVACSAKGVCAILLGDDEERLARDLRRQFPNARLIGDDARFADLLARVVGFVETPQRGLALPLDLRGTAFQQRVWAALQKIPLGSTASYGEIAERIGSPKAARAVARACASNRIALAIPCHRVVRNDGAASGYRWGAARKRALLAREAD